MLVGLGVQTRLERGRSPGHVESAGEYAVAFAPVAHALLHDLPDPPQRGPGLGLGSPGGLVGEHDLAAPQALRTADRQEFLPGGKRQR